VVLGKWAGYFDLEPESRGWKNFMDKASADQLNKGIGRFDGKEIFKFFPVFIHCGQDGEVDESDVRAIREKVKEAYTPDES
jgi:hypothetical protein